MLAYPRAMFSLRNRGGEAAALELASALSNEDNSLFKHEVRASARKRKREETIAQKTRAKPTRRVFV